MKKLLCIFVLMPLLLTGCFSSKEREACKEVAIAVYEEANDPTIVDCATSYNKKEEYVAYCICINEEEILYMGHVDDSGRAFAVKYDKDHILNEVYFDYYKQIESEASDNPNEDYPAFIFKADELK